MVKQALASSAALALLLFAPRVASAGDMLTFGVGALGSGGVVGLSKPGDTSVGANLVDNTYPGFFGSTFAAGVSAEGRLLGFLGLELDLLYAFSERGSGKLTLGGRDFDIDIGQPALHVPILAKAILPVGVVRPFIAFGPEVVLPGKSSATVSPSGLVTTIDAKADSYTLLTGALGLEIKLPLPSIDLRIPVAIRGSINPGTSDKITDRRDTTTSGNAISGIVYKSEWQYQGALTAGVSYWF